MIDELAQRRASKAARAAEPPVTALDAIEHADFLLCDLVGSLDGLLLVDVGQVRDVARQVDGILLGLRARELEWLAR